MAAQAVGDGKVACLVRRRVGKGIQGACAPMAERVRCFAAGVVERSEISECSEISENSERLANARAGLRLQASLHDGAVRGGGAWR